MNIKAIGLLTIILGSILLGSGCTPASPSGNQTANVTEGVNVGNRAIDFQVPALDGKTVKLSDYRGKPVLLNFWATWCGPCRGEVPFLNQINAAYSSQGLVMMAVDVGENSTTIQNFMTSLNVSLPAFMDANTTIAQNTYKVGGIPTTLMIDKNGIIRFRITGAFPDKASIETALKTIMP
jgi:thiol-disulfide isomerase/thioredoxin